MEHCSELCSLITVICVLYTGVSTENITPHELIIRKGAGKCSELWPFLPCVHCPLISGVGSPDLPKVPLYALP